MSARSNGAVLRTILLWAVVCLNVTLSTSLSGQTCDLSNFLPHDTLKVSTQLGDCEISALEVLDSFNIKECDQFKLVPPGPFSPDFSKVVVIYDQVKEEIFHSFYLKANPLSLEGIEGVSVDTAGVIHIRIQTKVGECNPSKDLLLDQLNIPEDEDYRNQINLMQGTSIVTTFPFGDTISLTSIECGGVSMYQDVRLFFEPIQDTKSSIPSFQKQLTTCKVTIEEVLEVLNFDVDSCGLNRFSISNMGPFGYGRHTIDYIKIDEHFIFKDGEINVRPVGCDIDHINFMQLPAGKCVLNEYDILDTLGFTSTGCGIDNIQLFPPGPYETNGTTIERIEIDGQPVCTQPFLISFTRDIVDDEQTNLICHQDLNIAMGPECVVMMNADVILADGNYCYLNYVIDLSYADNPDNIIDSGHELAITKPGRYSLTITNPATGNSCWSEFTVEDKFIEDIICVPDTLWCYESLDLVPDDTLGGGPDFPDLGPGVTYTPTFPANHYTISMATLCSVAFARYEDDVVEDCNGEFKQIIDRLWTFEDNFGNSDTCTQRLYVRNSSLDLVDHFDAFEADCILDFMSLDDNGYPSPEETGYPQIVGLYDAGICGTLRMTYNDVEFPLCGLGKKIRREWIIIDWCSEQVLELSQTIRIEDKVSPVILDTVADMSISSDPFICGGSNIDLPVPAFEDCNLDEVILEIIYETYDDYGNLVKRSNGSSLFIDEIKTIDIISTFSVEYILTDPCGNEARDTMMLTISDDEPPVAVCDDFTIISVGGSGNALVRAETFDDLSVDNCGILKYEVRKLEGHCDLTGEFRPDIRFCCEEVGDTIMVEFRVTDLAGNINTCEVRVNIQDKFRPIINCPDDITLDCGVDYEDLDITGRPVARDNCSELEVFYVDEVDLGQCYQGTIERTWMVRDRGGFTVSCTQVITIREDTLFHMDDAFFPPDTVIMGCDASLDPEFTGRPIIETSSCAMVDATHEDLYFYDVENACVKILREWTIIDWCQRTASNNGIWKKDQIIKLESDIGPLFLTEGRDTSYCINSSVCAEDITITGRAIDGDACTPADELTWTFALYGSLGELLENGVGHSITTFLESGNYSVVFEATDGCDNANLDTIRFDVIDCTAPIMTCPSVQPSLVLDPEGMAVLTVSDIVDVETSDNCDVSDEITLSFSPVADSSVMTFTCQDLIDSGSDRYIKLYAKDLSGNVDSCELFVQVRDNSDGLCGGHGAGDTLVISGRISTMGLSNVAGVLVTLSDGSGERTSITDDTGLYSFEDLTNGGDYNVSFEKNTDHSAGVTTLDILLAQRHILTIKRFDSPYQVIAADANNNGQVSAIDLVSMRRLVLGIDSLFTLNDQKSWRFVDAGQTFDDPSVPFPFIENIEADGLSSDMPAMDFMAVKIGDVNNSNAESSAWKADIRSGKAVLEASYVDGQLGFYASKDEMLGGLQIKVANIDADLVGQVEGGILPISREHYNVTDNGVALSWTNPEEGASIKKGDLLFSINIAEEEVFPFINGIIEDQSEWISDDLSVSKITIRKTAPETLTVLSNISNIQNAPNPFVDFTNITFSLDRPERVNISLIDISGRVVYHSVQSLNSGPHTLDLYPDELQMQPGLYILRLTTDIEQHVHKMTLVR